MEWVTSDELNRRIEDFRNVGGVVVFVNCAEIESRSSLDSAMRRSIPLDPRIDLAVPNWDSLQDSLFGGFEQMGIQRAVLVFARALPVRDLPKQVSQMLDDTVSTVASQLAVPRTQGAAMFLEILFELSV